MVDEFNGTQYQSGSFSLINVGSGFSLPAYFSFLHQIKNSQQVSFLSRTLHFSIYLTFFWLAGTSQQPISQTTWLSEGHPQRIETKERR
jgi:hypothetical protein